MSDERSDRFEFGMRSNNISIQWLELIENKMGEPCWLARRSSFLYAVFDLFFPNGSLTFFGGLYFSS
jgi:hypothetical protein